MIFDPQNPGIDTSYVHRPIYIDIGDITRNRNRIVGNVGTCCPSLPFSDNFENETFPASRIFA